MNPSFCLVATFTIVISACNTTVKDSNPKSADTLPLSRATPEKPYDSAMFNLELRPDTTLYWVIMEGLKTYTYISNEPYILDSSSNKILLSLNLPLDKPHSELYRLWPCNLPDYIKVGDTTLISGKVYTNTSKSEKMPGYPLLIEKIMVHTSYKNGTDRK